MYGCFRRTQDRLSRVSSKLCPHNSLLTKSDPPLRCRIAFWDSIQFLQIFGGGCQFIPSQDINELRAWLETNHTPLALFLEFPNNPLLQSAPLAELRKLANQYDFPIIIDDTIGNFCNVDVLGREGEKVLADVLVSSLTKSFSGFCDVMGGR